MTWQAALEIVIGRTLHERYRVLTAQDHPDHPAWRQTVLAMAGEPAPQFVPSPNPPAPKPCGGCGNKGPQRVQRPG